jgi:hypothetical protein
LGRSVLRPYITIIKLDLSLLHLGDLLTSKAALKRRTPY